MAFASPRTENAIHTCTHARTSIDETARIHTTHKETLQCKHEKCVGIDCQCASCSTMQRQELTLRLSSPTVIAWRSSMALSGAMNIRPYHRRADCAFFGITIAWGVAYYTRLAISKPQRIARWRTQNSVHCVASSDATCDRRQSSFTSDLRRQPALWIRPLPHVGRTRWRDRCTCQAS